MTYIPERGDVIWFDFDPSAGEEIQKRRPALVLSPAIFNQKTRFIFVAPITSTVRGLPLEVSFKGERVQGAIVVRQTRSLSISARNPVFVEKAPPAIVKAAQGMLQAILID